MKQEQIFNKVVSDFSAGVLGFRNGNQTQALNNIANHLRSARHGLRRSIQPMAGKQPLTVSNYLEISIDLKSFRTDLCSKLSLGEGVNLRELPIKSPLTEVLREDYFRHVCIEAYRKAKREEEHYFTGETLHERFIDELNNQLPEGARLGLSGSIHRPHTPHTSFVLKLTDLVE
ncbi:hypothetical protein [Vibrio phage phiKT1028]|nr:hypothetical protein [Vibrio phage phiKT1028]